jgi:hypothetical protein
MVQDVIKRAKREDAPYWPPDPKPGRVFRAYEKKYSPGFTVASHATGIRHPFVATPNDLVKQCPISKLQYITYYTFDEEGQVTGLKSADSFSIVVGACGEVEESKLTNEGFLSGGDVIPRQAGIGVWFGEGNKHK